MTSPVMLIAGREFRAYAATLSFWVALAIGPAIMGGALLMTGGHSLTPPSPPTIAIVPAADGAFEARFSSDFPLSETGRAQLLRMVEAEGRLGGALRSAAPAGSERPDLHRVSSFALVMMLWMTLTGSLGMLLQAVVRERSNRSLESLLAAARPSDIVMGKLAGVGAVSVLVVTAWLGSSLALAGLSPETGGLVSSLLHGFAEPLQLIRAGLIYLLAFGFYGLVTIAVGARARDNADAQNLARPMFAVLLAVFFTVLAVAGGAGGLGWLAFAPPFTPFILLAEPQTPGVEFMALLLLTAATVVAGWFAVNGLMLDSKAPVVEKTNTQVTAV
ncbi:MAG TPA: ABC transporter permease [Phenylobacterium sp.]|nr:ABC transporter permease [Phenylobacterium sp.]